MSHSCHASCQISCSFKDAILLQDIHFTQGQLETAISEAQKFHTEFLQTTQADEACGLKNPTPNDWAPRLLRKKNVAGAVLEKLGSLSFSKRKPDNTEPFHHYIQQRFDAALPLQFRVAFGPLKNIRCNGGEQSPDLAEYLTFIQLSRLMSAVASLYPHGVKVQLVPDDMRARQANRCPQCYVHCYISGLQKMAKMLSFEQWLHVEYGQSNLYEAYHVDSYQELAVEKLEHWRQTQPESFSARWNTAIENAKKNFNIELTTDTTEEVEAAAWRYLVAHQSELLSGMWSPPDVFPLVYANHPNCYQLYSMGHKKTKLPWQVALPVSLIDDTQRLSAF